MAPTHPAGGDGLPYRPRNYQYEMFEASLRENIIVAMDTGSGKTQVALLRIARELEDPDSQKLIWFLAPTVALCIQQHEVICNHLPAVKACTLTGLDKVDRWKNQSIWDEVLKGKQVVVSTHTVLLDALTHGFVKISQLGLVIFDEAHHCMRQHPANKIMQHFYHPWVRKYGKDSVPRILGLTASPIVRSNEQELLMIESNLAAVCRTPRVHRQELLTYSYRPELRQIWFTPLDPEGYKTQSKTLQALVHAWETIDLEDDPYVQQLRKSPVNGEVLHKTLMTRKTDCNQQIKKFVERSCHIFEELGEWAAEYYISASVEQLRTLIRDSCLMMDWEDEEKSYLLNFLSRIPVPDIQGILADVERFPMSPKLKALMDFLDSFDGPDFSGLVFVKQRVTVSVMAQLLSLHPRTRDRFRCAAYVGWSNSGSRKDIMGELLSMHKQRNTLNDFKSGRKNLIVATDVLEEGIDVTACRVVVCYDKPPNLKSYVQRRGRARQKKSTYAIMSSKLDETGDMRKWQGLEAAMVEAYRDQERQLHDILVLETIDEDILDRLTVEATGYGITWQLRTPDPWLISHRSAVMTPDSVVQHLYHFCVVLPEQRYVDNRPEFSFEKDKDGLLRGTVILPNCVHPKVRRIEGRRFWQTERAAIKDAALRAYRALYEFGLLNDHLLPLTETTELRPHSFAALPSVVEASEQYDPWLDWAYSWSSPDFHEMRICLQRNEHLADELFLRLTGPTVLPPLMPMTLYWDRDTTLTISFGVPKRVPTVTANCLETIRATTALYLQSPRNRQLPSENEHDFVTLFGPDLPPIKLADWLTANTGHEPALEVYSRGVLPSAMGIVRDPSRYGEPLFCRRWMVSEDGQVPAIALECSPIPRRRNFLHPLTLADGDSDTSNNLRPGPAKVYVSPAKVCSITKLPMSEAVFGLFIPLIVDQLQSTLTATKLCTTILRDVEFTNIQHVITAITAPVALAVTDYQRYEFLGDSILKFIVSCQLFFQHLNWPEGYLTEARGAIVQNPRLTRAAIDAELDAFIMTKRLTPRKWTAPLISKSLAVTSAKRQLSSKVLADVVEALIGAAYLDGGFAKAQTCIHRFLPEVNRQPLDIPSITQTLVPGHTNPRHTIDETLQRHLGYTFKNESLLIEALTHPSCQYDSTTQSFQRLEFLGDAILDMIINPIIFAHSSQIQPKDMTLIRHAVVNANLLAFFCMEFSIPQTTTHVHQIDPENFTVKTESKPIELWRFMRFNSLDLQNSRTAALSRHQAYRDEVRFALQHGNQYPWQALSQLNADKYFSDLVESILGAIFVDSGELVEE
ncbi:Dicer-like protein 2 [Aspergillus hancockii]|nr:Dicer-like protein 2 [Aspergillus hancockii]